MHCMTVSPPNRNRNPIPLPQYNVIRITTKITRQLSTEFRENQSSSVCVILLTNKHTNKSSADENIISLAEVIKTKLERATAGQVRFIRVSTGSKYCV